MDEKMRISNAEMKVMNQIWKAEEMVTVPGGAGNSEEGGRGMDLSDRSNLFKTADGEGDFRGNEEGKQALLFPFGKQRTV